MMINQTHERMDKENLCERLWPHPAQNADNNTNCKIHHPFFHPSLSPQPSRGRSETEFSIWTLDVRMLYECWGTASFSKLCRFRRFKPRSKLREPNFESFFADFWIVKKGIILKRHQRDGTPKLVPNSKAELARYLVFSVISPRQYVTQNTQS